MAGSLTYREYQSDHGTKYSILVDKSNANKQAAYTQEKLCNLRSQNWELPPKSLILRRVHCFSQEGVNIRRSFIVGNPKVFNLSNLKIGQEYLINPSSTPGDTSLNAWIITGYTGERFSCPQFYGQLDTGINDGSVYN
jgi:hypothetical protein